MNLFAVVERDSVVGIYGYAQIMLGALLDKLNIPHAIADSGYMRRELLLNKLGDTLSLCHENPPYKQLRADRSPLSFY